MLLCSYGRATTVTIINRLFEELYLLEPTIMLFMTVYTEQPT